MTAVSSVPALRWNTAQGRWVVTAAVLGSGVAFLDGIVVNTALPAIGEDLNAGLSSLQWTLTAYLLTLGSLLVLGGSLGDHFGRRLVFTWGLAGFSATSLLCGLAPTSGLLIAARALQGVAAAALVPGSLALLSASFHPEDRARAIGAWSGLAGTATAAGPFLGGWLIDSVSWRWVFLVNLPLTAVAIAISVRHVPETSDEAAGPLDLPGAAALSLGLAGVVYALIEGPARGPSFVVVMAAMLGAAALAAFVVVQARSPHPMVPLSVFRSRQFSGANAVTFVVYGALGAVSFLLMVHLQQDLGYSALEAGASTLPITVALFAFSARAGALAQRIGPRLPMTLGPLLVAGSFALFTRVGPGATYAGEVLPAVVALGAGLTLTVAPLTAAVLAAIEDNRAGVGSAINNAVARVASLLAIAVLPAAAGIATGAGEPTDGLADVARGFDRAMVIGAVLAGVGALVAWTTIRRVTPMPVPTPPPPTPMCGAYRCFDAGTRRRFDEGDKHRRFDEGDTRRRFDEGGSARPSARRPNGAQHGQSGHQQRPPQAVRVIGGAEPGLAQTPDDVAEG